MQSVPGQRDVGGIARITIAECRPLVASRTVIHVHGYEVAINWSMARLILQKIQVLWWNEVNEESVHAHVRLKARLQCIPFRVSGGQQERPEPDIRLLALSLT